MNKVVANEVKNAYSDCHDYKAGPRNLDFRASQPVSLIDAVEIMTKYVPGYNEFKPELLYQLPKDVKVTIAREGSVCVYLQLPETLNSDIVSNEVFETMRLDECHVQDNNELRLWWD